MGIPSYFSHIIRNHNIIIKKNSSSLSINNLYIDSNSIIYDIIHGSEANISHQEIYKSICQKILFYIDQIKPSDNVFISFDGVAPIAKLSQQRTRRIKNTILKKIHNEFEKTEKKKLGHDTDYTRNSFYEIPK